jgi:hypothetical protein
MESTKQHSDDALANLARLHMENVRTSTLAILRLPDTESGAPFLLEICPELLGNARPDVPYEFGPGPAYRAPVALSLAPLKSILSHMRRSVRFARAIAAATVLEDTDGIGERLVRDAKEMLPPKSAVAYP